MTKITTSTIENVFKAKVMSRENMELKGYELIDEIFSDSSGFGLENEPAATVSQLARKLKQLTSEHGALYVTITGMGMFQVYVGVFKRTGTKKATIYASNTLRFVNDEGDIVYRLYDTNIVTVKVKTGDVILDNGGFSTMTTHKRMNDILRKELGLSSWVGRKNWVSVCNKEPFVNNVYLLKKGE